MKLTQSIRLALPLSMLFILIGIGGAVFFGWHLNQQAEKKIAGQVEPSVEALDNMQGLVDAYVLRARTDFENSLLDKVGTVPNEFPTPEINYDLRHFLGKVDEDLIQTENLNGDVKLLRSNLNNLADALNEFDNRIDNLEGGSKSKRERDALETSLTKTVLAYNEVVPPYYKNVKEDIAKLRKKIKGVQTAEQDSIAANQTLAFIFLAGGLGLGLIGLVINYIVLGKSIHGPMKRLLGRMKTRQPIRVEKNEVGSIASYLNRLHLEQKTTELTIDKFSKGAYKDEFDQDAMPERVVAGFLGIRNRMRDTEEEIQQKEDKIRDLETQLESAKSTIGKRDQQLDTARANRRKGGLVLEMDDTGKFAVRQ